MRSFELDINWVKYFTVFQIFFDFHASAFGLGIALLAMTGSYFDCFNLMMALLRFRHCERKRWVWVARSNPVTRETN
jgi:hypothetical protein